jgi:hypothetical protein
MQNSVIVGELMRENKLSEVMEQCRSSQIMATNLLSSASDVLISQIRQQSIENENLNHTSLLALKVLQSLEGIRGRLIDEALRHILVVDHIQKGQLTDIITSNNTILNNIASLALSGNWLLLVSKLSCS